MSSIILTPEQQKADLKERLGKFTAGLKALEVECRLGLVAKIKEDGPVIEVIPKEQND